MTRALLGGADCARAGVAVVLRGFGNASATEAWEEMAVVGGWGAGGVADETTPTPTPTLGALDAGGVMRVVVNARYGGNASGAAVMAVLDAYTEGAPATFDYVVTFDAGGVSGHANHVGTHRGARQWIEERKNSVVKASDAGKCPQVWVLETTNIARKFSGAVDWFASYVECSMDSRRVFVPSPSPLEVLRAVRLHKSQFVWYRKLFVAFSRYTYMNTLRRID